MSKKFLRKAGVAARYSVDPRSVNRMQADGRIPKPTRMLGRIPIWDEEVLDANDRAAAIAPRPAGQANV
jgi:hypothetical protein